MEQNTEENISDNKMFSKLWFFFIVVAILFIVYKINKIWKSWYNSIDIEIPKIENKKISTRNHQNITRDMEKVNEVKKLIFIKSVIEKKFNDRFMKINVPDDNSIGCCDYYNGILKIGVVFCREQDCVWPNSVNETEEEFTKRTSRKRKKINICKEHGIKMIIIRYDESDESIKRIIEQQ